MRHKTRIHRAHTTVDSSLEESDPALDELWRGARPALLIERSLNRSADSIERLRGMLLQGGCRRDHRHHSTANEQQQALRAVIGVTIAVGRKVVLRRQSVCIVPATIRCGHRWVVMR